MKVLKHCIYIQYTCCGMVSILNHDNTMAFFFVSLDFWRKATVVVFVAPPHLAFVAHLPLLPTNHVLGWHCSSTIIDFKFNFFVLSTAVDDIDCHCFCRYCPMMCQAKPQPRRKHQVLLSAFIAVVIVHLQPGRHTNLWRQQIRKVELG